MADTANPHIRVFDGIEAPVPGDWVFDPVHTNIMFVARYAMLTKIRGRFNTFDGVIHVAESPEDSWVEVTIDASSISTDNEQRDEHLRSGDFLDLENEPDITFRSTVLHQADVRLAGDEGFENRGHGLGRLPLARMDAAVHEHGRLGESLRGVRIRVADDIGPDLAPRERLADHLAIHFVVEREQRLVLREERVVLAKSGNRRHRCDRYRRRIAERDVGAEVVVLGVGEDDVAATRRKRVRDFAI